MSGLWFRHSDYCGHGAVYSLGQFYLNEVYDGYADSSRKIQTWRNEESLRIWLGKQGDYSLSGADNAQPELLANTTFELNNQRLPKERLVDYVTYGRR